MADHVEEILDEATRRFGHAEVFLEDGETRSVSFENNRLKSVSARQYRGVGLRVFAEGRIGFASTTDLRDPRRLVDMAAESAQFGEEAGFDFPGPPQSPPDVPTEDAAVGQVSLETMADMGRDGLEMSIAASAAYLFGANVSTKIAAERVVNSSGLDVQYVKTDMAADVEVQEVTESGLLWVFESKAWGQPFGSLTDLTRTALRKMKQGRNIARVSAQVMPVLFTAKAADNLFGPLMLALCGKHVYKGSSVLAGRMGERIVDPRITILDDATVPYAPGSGPADSEGVSTRPVTLLDEGVLESYLLDLRTASLLDMDTTGNGYRSYASQPAPGSSNTVIAAGSDAYEDMIRDIERGIIVDQTLGSGQSNVLAGEMSVNVHLGFLIEGGKVQGRVKDCMVAGNVYELLSQIEGISREREWVGSDYLPAVCVGGIKLAAQG